MPDILSTIRHKATWLLIAATAALATACSDSDADEVHLPTLYDIAEVTAVSAEGTTFSVYRPDADEPAVLTATGYVPATTEPGNCVFLGYTMTDGRAPYTSGPVQVQACGRVTNSRLKRGSSESLAGWNLDPVWLTSLWRAGGWICMQLNLPYSTEPRQFSLVIDDATATDEVPQAYLYHRRNDTSPNFSRRYYAAFDVSELWKTTTCRALEIHVANSNNPTLTTFHIPNPLSTPVPSN